jgi:hypothetical protein
LEGGCSCVSASAACLVELIEDGAPGAGVEEADKLMKQVPKLTKKLAGKSLPIEVRLALQLSR